MLSPDFPAPNAYQLYVIKGAKEAKEGQIPLDAVGIKTPDSKTLVVELVQPTPYFLELTSCHFFFPVSKATRENNQNPNEKIVSNGPFVLSRHSQRNEISFAKNNNYWDNKSVNLETITLQILDETTALNLYHSKQIDWAGSPLSTLPQDSLATLKKEEALTIADGSGTYWFRLNTNKLPFNNQKLRQAFALALNREEIVNHVTQGNQVPAIGIIPPSFAGFSQNYFKDNDQENAKKLYKEAIAELGSLPTITLNFASNDRNHKIAGAVQQQWNKAFGIDIALEAMEPSSLNQRIRQGSYQMTLGSWFADITDPINFLEIFQSKSNPTNQTGWENNNYAQLIDKLNLELAAEKRRELAQKAEKLLIHAMPIIPLFHSSYNTLKNDRLKGVYFSPLGYLDFKNSYSVIKYLLNRLLFSLCLCLL